MKPTTKDGSRTRGFVTLDGQDKYEKNYCYISLNILEEAVKELKSNKLGDIVKVQFIKPEFGLNKSNKHERIISFRFDWPTFENEQKTNPYVIAPITEEEIE